MNQQLARNISQAYVMAQYLQNFARVVGESAYLNSYIRKEHGTGTGFFGVGNTGSVDCVKERFRGITDNLGQRWSCWQQIQFVSESCRDINSPCFRTVYRVEHTREVIDLYNDFEREFIITGNPFTANDLACWVITNQVVCLIRQDEQLGSRHYNDLYPFSKYSKRILYNGQDISGYSLAQLKALNQTRFAEIMQEIRAYDFSWLNKKHNQSLLNQPCKKHTLPLLDLAVKFHNNQFELLDQHYHHKLNKRTDPNNKKYYNKEDAEKFNQWKHNEKLRMA